METHGEGGGDEAGRRGTGELRHLLEAIESSEVLEKRIPLIKQLEGSSHFSADDLGLILQGLLASWIDSTCSGVSHCTLHRSILQVALKCSDLDITDDCLGQFLTLGAKASSWCEKHCKWSVKSVEESQVVQEEEHDRLCLEINSLSFILSTKVLGIAAKCFTALGLELAAGEGGQGAAQEECVLNKADDAFPTLETMAMEVEPAPAHLDVGATPWSLAPVLSPPTQKAARRCTHCASVKTPRWLRGPDGPGTLCNACGLRFYKGRLLQSNSRRCQGHPSKKRHPSKENGAAVLGEVPSENGPAPLPQEASRRCMHCTSEKTPRWLCGPNGPGTLCNACGLRFYRGRLLNSYSSRRQGHPSKKRRPSKENSNDVAVAPWSLAPLPQDAWRRCTHCASEKTTRWLQGPDGPGTLCNACGQRFKKGRLNSRGCRGHCSSSMENSAAGNDLMAALVEALPCDVGASLDAFFDQKSLGLEMSWEEAGPERKEEDEELEWLWNKVAFPSVETMAPMEVEVEEELEWLWNKDAFPSVETMAPMEMEVEEELEWLWNKDAIPSVETMAPVEVEEDLEWLWNKDAFPSVETMAPVEVEAASILDPLPASARTTGRRRVTAMETCRQANVLPAEKETVVSPVLPRRRCTHCATEETPAWRVGPEGPYTLCNPCGIVFVTKGRLLPEYRPANSPGFSRQLHSNRYSRALEMHRQNETSANGSLCRVLEEHRQSEEETSAIGRATAKDDRRAERCAARLAALDK